MALVITWGYGASAVVPTAGYGGAIVSPCVPLFSLDSVEIQDPKILRVRFTKPPLVGSGATAARADHAPNYVLTNESNTVSIGISLASVVSTDSEVIDLYLDSEMSPDIWELSVVSTIESAAGATLTPPLEYRFELSQIENPDLADGARNRSCVETLKAYFNPAFRAKPKWQALLNAVAEGDCIVREVVESGRDQVWLSTASGRYLAGQASNYAIAKPQNTGISDDDFRQLAITIKNNKLTQSAFLRVLETVYGDSATRAYTESDLGPFVLFEGASLVLLIDDTETVDVRFTRSQFGILRRATATEVAVVINTRLQEVASEAYAVSYTDPSTGAAYLRIFSGTLGLRSSIRVLPSTAQIAFNFDTQLFGPTTFTLPTWVLTKSGDVLRLRPSHGAVYDIRDVETDDYVVILGSGFSAPNRGAFTIVDTYYGGISNQWIEIRLPDGVAETVTQCDILDVQFYRSTRRTVHSSGSRVIVTQTNQSTRIEIPTTTRIVQRDLDSASYLNENSSISGVLTRIGNDVSITTGVAHGVSPGDQVEIEVDSDLVVPTIASETSSADFDLNGEARGGSGSSSVSLWRQDTTFEGALFRAAQDTSGRAWVVGGQLEDVGTFTTITQAAVFDILESDATSYDYQWTRRSTLFYTKPIGGTLVAPTASALKSKMIASGGYSTNPWDDFDPMFTASDQGLLSKIVLDPPALVAEQFSSTEGLLAATGWFSLTNPSSGIFGVSDGVVSRTYGWGLGGDVTVTIGADVATSMANLVTAINSDGSAAWTAVLSTGFPEINPVVVIIIEDAVLAGRSGLRVFANSSNLADQRVLKYATSLTSVVNKYDDPIIEVPDVIAPIYGIAGSHRDLPSLVEDETHFVLGINQYRHWNGVGWLSSFDWIAEVGAGGLPNTVADHSAVRISDTSILMSGGVNVPNLAVKDVVLYNQSTMSASPSGDLVEARAQHRSVRLTETSALIIGGRRPADDSLRTGQGYDTWDFGDNAVTFAGPVTVGLGANRRVIGKIGHGLRFTFGPAASIGGGDQTSLNAQLLGDYTISGWMTAGAGVVFRNGVASPAGSADNTAIEFGVDPSDNKFFVRWMYGANTVVTKKSTSTYVDLMGPTVLDPYPRYHHFAITKANNGSYCLVELYINGALTDSWTDTKPDGGANGLWIFSDTDGALTRFQGAVDEVGITSTVLTSDQIRRQYYSELGVMYDNPTGVDLSPIGTVLNSCEILTSASSVLVSPMAYARFASGICQLPDGRILVAGGVGYLASQPRYEAPQRQAELRSVEIYDPSTGIWSQLPDMRDPHSYPLCEYDATTNKVYVCGGFTSIRTEYLDLKTMKWGIGPSIGSVRARGGGTKSGRIMLVPGGSDDIYNSYNTTNPHDAHFLPQSESVYGGGLNGVFTAVAPTSGFQISLRTPDHEGYNTGSATIRPVGATTDLISSYLHDDTYSPTSVSGVLQNEIRKGKAVTRIVLDTDEALAFGDTGHVIIAFGNSYQSPVLQYRRRGGSELDIIGIIGSWINSFGSATSIPAGAVVHQVKISELQRPLIATAAEAGRNAAISILQSISAAGFDLDIITRYPNDRGLGAEGWGSSGDKKSDQIWVWSGQ